MEFSLLETGAGKVLCGPGGQETALLLRLLISAVQNWKAGHLVLGTSWQLERKTAGCRPPNSSILHLRNPKPIAFAIHLSHWQ